MSIKERILNTCRLVWWNIGLKLFKGNMIPIKPKTIYKDGLRWNLLPKEVYGKEMYVPCNTPYHYWDMGINGGRMIEKLEENEELKTKLTELKEMETFDQCPRALPCPFCSCIMELTRIEEKELIYRCPCCQKYKGVRRMTEKRFKTLFDNVQDGHLTIIHDVNKETAYTLNQTVELLNGLDGTIKDLSDDYQRLMRENKELKKENKKLKTELLDIEEDRDYFKSKASSLEDGYIKLQDQEIRLQEELDYWKKRALLLEKKYDEGDSVKWLRENTVWEQMPSTRKTKISVSDINGLVKTDEPTNSVELKKELYK